MSESFEHHARRILSGEAKGVFASVARSILRTAEVPYAAAVSARNRAFDDGRRVAERLPRPVVSVGNVTTGGTGKTPVIRWLAGRLRDQGRSVAVLSRGYKSRAGEWGDEQRMLDTMLNRAGVLPVRFENDASRVAAGRRVLAAAPGVDVFLLDDGFQHRQLARDFDLVLLNAADPFGFGHVLPRGLLREPTGGLKRADAILLTRCDEVDVAVLAATRDLVRRQNPDVPVFRSDHGPSGFRTPTADAPLPTQSINGRWCFAFCGIATPASFVDVLTRLGATVCGRQFFPDHHAYGDADIAALRRRAAEAHADLLVTTEKDWAKLRALPTATSENPPIWRLDVNVRFHGDDESALFESISRVVAAGGPAFGGS